jgi:hypothetical protein
MNAAHHIHAPCRRDVALYGAICKSVAIVSQSEATAAHATMIAPTRAITIHILPQGFHRIRHYGLRNGAAY